MKRWEGRRPAGEREVELEWGLSRSVLGSGETLNLARQRVILVLSLEPSMPSHSAWADGPAQN